MISFQRFATLSRARAEYDACVNDFLIRHEDVTEPEERSVSELVALQRMRSALQVEDWQAFSEAHAMLRVTQNLMPGFEGLEREGATDG